MSDKITIGSLVRVVPVQTLSDMGAEIHFEDFDLDSVYEVVDIRDTYPNGAIFGRVRLATLVKAGSRNADVTSIERHEVAMKYLVRDFE